MRVFPETGPLLPLNGIDGASSELCTPSSLVLLVQDRGFWALRSSCAKSPCLRQTLRIKITPLPRLRHFRCIREIIEDSSDLSPQLRLPIGKPGLSVSTMFLSQPMYRPARFFCLSRQIGQLGCRLARTSCPRHRSHLHLCSNLVGARVRTPHCCLIGKLPVPSYFASEGFLLRSDVQSTHG